MRIKDYLPIELITYVHSFMPYKQNFDKVLTELIKFDIHDEWEGLNDTPFYGMKWKGVYTYGYIWVRGTSMRFTKHTDHIQVENLILVINYIDGKTTYPYANDMFGAPETEQLILGYDDLLFLKGDIDVRDELIRVDKIAKRNHVSQYWI